jgi:hypothetical protein
MHSRRLACLLLGIWLGGSLVMAVITARTGSQADLVLDQATDTARIELKAFGPNFRTLMQYQAAEANRWYVRNWALAQIGIGTAFFLIMLFGSQETAFVLIGILAMLLFTALQAFFIVPEWAALGRMLDFVPAGQSVPEHGKYLVLRTAYFGAEGAKCAMGLVLAASMVFSRRRSGRSRDSRREFDVVNKSNYRGVNR